MTVVSPKSIRKSLMCTSGSAAAPPDVMPTTRTGHWSWFCPGRATHPAARQSRGAVRSTLAYHSHAQAT